METKSDDNDSGNLSDEDALTKSKKARRSKEGPNEKSNSAPNDATNKNKEKNGGGAECTEEDEDEGDVEFPCGICNKEVNDNDEAILCESGCSYWYHRTCTGITLQAYQLLTNEDNAEWVCDKCIATISIPAVKLKY